MMRQLIRKFTTVSIMASVALHASAGGSLYLVFLADQNRKLREVDLSAVSMVQSVNAGRAVTQEEDWALPRKNLKNKMVQVVERVPAAQDQAACIVNCEKSGLGTGSIISAADAQRKPRWISNFISANDYPLLARQNGKDGRVVLSVIIDENGQVRDAQLLEGSYHALNEIALLKVKEATFSPALDNTGKAVACRVRLPIRFELK